MLAECNCCKRQCKWYVGIIQPDGTELTEANMCGAFPNGIPDDIAYGDNLHNKQMKGQDKPYTYEKSDDWENQFDKLPMDDILKWQEINGNPWTEKE